MVVVVEGIGIGIGNLGIDFLYLFLFIYFYQVVFSRFYYYYIDLFTQQIKQSSLHLRFIPFYLPLYIASKGGGVLYIESLAVDEHNRAPSTKAHPKIPPDTLSLLPVLPHAPKKVIRRLRADRISPSSPHPKNE